MSILFLGFEGPESSYRRDAQIADHDLPRILRFLMKQSFGQVTDVVQTPAPDPDWTPGEGQTEADRPTVVFQTFTQRPATPGEVMAAFANSIVDKLLADTIEDEKQEAATAAAAAAVAAVLPIVVNN